MNERNDTLRTLSLIAVAALLAGCAPAAKTTTSSEDTWSALGWLAGCWQADGASTKDMTEETWVESMHGNQMFGYSVTTKDATQVFFEQLRIDVKTNTARLHAYPNGVGPTTFEGRLSSSSSSIEFTNKDNDYPQRIRYARSGDRLSAEISLLDRSRRVTWEYRACE